MFAVLTAAMYIIYRKIRFMHIDLLLDAGYYLNKHVPRELVNFIYYKISEVVAILLMSVRTRWNIENAVPDPFPRATGFEVQLKQRGMATEK